MTVTEMTTKPALMPDKALLRLKSTKLAVGRRVADDELWQRLDQKMAEREMLRKSPSSLNAGKGIFVRLMQGMGIRRD